MNKRKIIIIVSIILLLVTVFVGIKSCSKDENQNNEQINNIENENTPIFEEEKEEDNTELYTSTKGYELRYDPNKFQLNIEDGKEKFVYIEDENEIYFMVQIIESEDIKSIKDNLIASAEVSGNCKISNGSLSGVYAENEKDEIKKQNLIFELSETKLLIIEINKYNDNNDVNSVNEYFKNMIKTFQYN